MKKAKKTQKRTVSAGKKVKTKATTPAIKAKTAKTGKLQKAIAEQDAPPKTLKLSKELGAKYKSLLLELRDHLIDRVSFLASDNLKRTHRDASGELSGYSLHMADAGTDNFDREFALSLVSNEQEALYEIEEALRRLDHGTYGLCGMCDKPIRKERLTAVPFARLCVQCQSDIEKDRRRPSVPVPTFSDSGDDESAEPEESEE